MKRLLPCFATSLLVITALACQKAAEPRPMAQETASSSATPTSTQATTTPATAPYDLQFLDTMTRHHASAVEMASMAG
ncbi:MAG: DUF305 domain-containing protein, partial [Thermoanaerobaculia bacterium]